MPTVAVSDRTKESLDVPTRRPLGVGRRRHRTKLSPVEEAKFETWYADFVNKNNLNPDPDAPGHKYDYRGAFKANVRAILAEDGWYHMSSKFKDFDHPNRFVEGQDTITGNVAISRAAKPDKTRVDSKVR